MQTSRQEDILPNDRSFWPITIIGAGGIGSATAIAIAKMGFEDITVYDDDTVEEHNIPNQMLRIADIGIAKVFSLGYLIKGLTGNDITPIAERIDGTDRLSGIVICAVDNMEARKEIFAAVQSASLFIDARMSGEYYDIYTVLPGISDKKFWEANWYPSAEADQAPCTAKAIIYNTLSIGAEIACIVRKFATGDKFPLKLSRDMRNDIFSIVERK